MRAGKTLVRLEETADAIPTTTVRDLCDLALMATLTYSFAGIGAALAMRVADVRAEGAGWELRLHEKGGRQHTMPCYHALAEALHGYIAAAGISTDRTGVLFRTSQCRGRMCFPRSRWVRRTPGA
jgi:integrase